MLCEKTDERVQRALLNRLRQRQPQGRLRQYLERGRAKRGALRQRRMRNLLAARCGPSQPTRRAAKGPSRQLWAERHTSDKARNPGHSVYDVWNRQVKVYGSNTVAYAYDALGRRVLSTMNGTATDLYFSSQWQVLEEEQANRMTEQYVWSPVYIDALIERDSGLTNTRTYAQQDANWNVTAAVSNTGAVQERYVYDPYGKPTFLAAGWVGRNGSSINWVYLFQGGRYDTTSGLYHFRFRDYSPTLGRWVQQDPLGNGAGDDNLYRFVWDDSTDRTDPSGLVTQSTATGGPLSSLTIALAENPILVTGILVETSIIGVGGGTITVTVTDNDNKDKKPTYVCTTKPRGCCPPQCQQPFVGYGYDRNEEIAYRQAKGAAERACQNAGCHTPGGKPFNCNCGHTTCRKLA